MADCPIKIIKGGMIIGEVAEVKPKATKPIEKPKSNKKG